MDTWSATALRGSASEHVALCHRLAAHFGVRHVVVVDHGTTAIRAALWAFRTLGELGHGHVGAPCNVWRGVYSGIAGSGARRLVLCDVDPECGVIGQQNRTFDAMVAVDGFAVSAPILDLRSCAPVLVEDASLNQHPSRSDRGELLADACVMSFQSNKLLSCGEGGAVLTDRPDVADAVEQAVCDGRTWRSGLRAEPQMGGFNGMMPGSSLPLLRTQLADLGDYLTSVRDGITRVVSRLGDHAVPSWVDDHLRASGKLFALPITRPAEDPATEQGIVLDHPPGPPTREALTMLRELPVEIDVRPFPGAEAASYSFRLVPHWRLAEIGSP